MKRYTVTVSDCAGEFDFFNTDSFAEALERYRESSLKYGHEKVVSMTNWDRADYDTNGLTEDERDAIAEVA